MYLNYSAEYQVQEDNRAESQAIRVLVVDDEMLIRWSLYQTLRRHGFEADIAADAMEASDKFANNTYDYLMIDYKMPGKDGLAFAEEISHIYPDTRVILMTAFGSEEVERQAHKLGVKYMSKPIDLDHISEILR